MNIRIIENQNEVECRPLDDKRILLINREKITTNIGTSFVPFSRIYYFIYDTEKNIREELLPDLVKYEVASFSYGERSCPYVYFFTVDFDRYPIGVFHMQRYHIDDLTCSEIIRFEDTLRDYALKKQLQIFLLNNDYCLLQYSYLKELPNGYSGYFEFSSELIDLSTSVHYKISEKSFAQYGLHQLVPVANNVVCLKFGWSVKDPELKKNIHADTAALETICLVNTSQLISDLILGIENGSCEIIDQVKYKETFSLVSRKGKYLIYTKYNTEDGSYKIIYYQYISKEPTVLCCKPFPSSDKEAFGFILDQHPFVARYTSKYLEILDLKSSEVVTRFSQDSEIVDVEYGYLLVKAKKKSLLSAQPTFEIYQYPDFLMVSRLKAYHLTWVSLTGSDLNLITFK